MCQLRGLSAAVKGTSASHKDGVGMKTIAATALMRTMANPTQTDESHCRHTFTVPMVIIYAAAVGIIISHYFNAGICVLHTDRTYDPTI